MLPGWIPSERTRILIFFYLWEIGAECEWMGKLHEWIRIERSSHAMNSPIPIIESFVVKHNNSIYKNTKLWVFILSRQTSPFSCGELRAPDLETRQGDLRTSLKEQENSIENMATPRTSGSFEPSLKRLSVSSRTSLNPTQGLIPISPTDFCHKRLTGWGTVIKNLIRFFELTVEQERRLSDVKMRHSKELAVASPHLFEDEESFQVGCT